MDAHRQSRGLNTRSFVPLVATVTSFGSSTKKKRWAISATLNFGFTPMWGLCGDLYGGVPDQVRDFCQSDDGQGVYGFMDLSPPLFIVQRTKDPERIYALSRELVAAAEAAEIDVLVLDHFRSIRSKNLNPNIMLPLIAGLKSAKTKHLREIHIFVESSRRYEMAQLFEATKLAKRKGSDLWSGAETQRQD